MNLNDIINFSNQIGNSKLKADEFVNDLSKTPIALFKIKNIKQGNKIFEKASGRIVALPLSEKYEPWTKSLFDYF